jgi:hypothetical protein
MNNETMLIKYKSVGWTDKQIAARMGIPAQEVTQRWEHLQSVASSQEFKGKLLATERFTDLCRNYELVGEGLKNISELLCSAVEPMEIKRAIPSLTDEQILSIIQHYIVLRPPIPPPLPTSN